MIDDRSSISLRFPSVRGFDWARPHRGTSATARQAFVLNDLPFSPPGLVVEPFIAGGNCSTAETTISGMCKAVAGWARSISPP